MFRTLLWIGVMAAIIATVNMALHWRPLEMTMTHKRYWICFSKTAIIGSDYMIIREIIPDGHGSLDIHGLWLYDFCVHLLLRQCLFSRTVFCGDHVSDGDDCNTLTYWQSGNPDFIDQRCGQAGWLATNVTNLLDDDHCTTAKNVVCDIGMLLVVCD